MKSNILKEIPHTAWIILLNHLGLYNTCLLRNINKSIKYRVDQTLRQVYSRIEGKCDYNMYNYLDFKIIYPKIDFYYTKNRDDDYNHLKSQIQHFEYSKLFELINEKDLFDNILYRLVIHQINLKKLKKAIKLVLTGLSNHYSIKCMDLSHESINWAIQLKSQNICDIFCYRAAAEFNENQIKNLLRVQKHTYQDCFAFFAAEKLNDSEIDLVIENKKKGKLDYDAIKFSENKGYRFFKFI